MEDAAAFLQGMVGAVVAKGCADVIARAPPDPILHLSLWLLKYVANNTNISRAFFEDREHVRQQQQLREQTEKQRAEMRAECAREEAEAIRRLREIQEPDPYLLFDSCLKTVKAFTGRFIISFNFNHPFISASPTFICLKNQTFTFEAI